MCVPTKLCMFRRPKSPKIVMDFMAMLGFGLICSRVVRVFEQHHHLLPGFVIKFHIILIFCNKIWLNKWYLGLFEDFVKKFAWFANTTSNITTYQGGSRFSSWHCRIIITIQAVITPSILQSLPILFYVLWDHHTCYSIVYWWPWAEVILPNQSWYGRA